MKRTKPQILRIEPHFISTDDLSDEYDGPDMLAYRIYANKRVIAKEAHPLRSTDVLVSRRINKKEPWFDYSGAYWKVRRIQDRIMWFGEYIAYYYAKKETHYARGEINYALPVKWMKIFAFDQYTQTLDAAYEETTGAWQQVSYPEDYHILNELPHISPVEVHSIVQSFVPLSLEKNVAQRQPEGSEDSTGVLLYRKIYDALEEHIGLQVCDAPDNYTEFKFRFHFPTYSIGNQWHEWTWLVGQVDGHVAIYFKKQWLNRYEFPFWVCGEALDKAFASEF